MPDLQETKCNITAVLALRCQRNEFANSTTSTTTTTNSHNDACDEKKQATEITLPDAIIRHLILSYRPFRPFRVVLIRGQVNAVYGTNHFGGNSSNPRKREYSLTFGTNRGNLRFRVVELPYLPPHNKSIDAKTYRGADGVVISCYMTRFFEFCDRYGYNYASSSILEDVKARRGANIQQQDDELHENAGERLNNNEKRRVRRKTFPRCIVLCGNNTDITHVDARLPSIVFCEESEQPTSTSSTSSTSTASSSTTTTNEASERKYSSTNTHVETPRHPFSSLARSLTKDYGLEFHDICASGSSKDSYQLLSSVKDTHDKHWNHDDEAKKWRWLRAQVS